MSSWIDALLDLLDLSSLPDGALAVIAGLLLIVILILLVRGRKFAEAIATKQTEELLSSRELFLELYRNSPVPYLLVSYKGEITFPNAAALRLFKATERELDGANLFDMFTAEDDAAQSHVDLLPSLFHRKSPILNEEVRVRRGDNDFWVLLSVFPFSRGGGKHNGLVTLVDITKQKEVERAKTEFVSLASHQLRTPLSSLRWNMELLVSPKTGNLNDKQRAYTETIARGIERMGLIVEDFLNVSRLELGTLVVEKREVNLSELVESILRELSEPIARKVLEVRKELDVLAVTSDPRLLRMALSNLLSNAVKYIQNEGEIRIGARPAGAAVEIEVSDNGVGIPADEQDKIFTRFFRASNVRNEVPQGTGLGLYIVRLIAQALGGTVRFSSKEGVGTTFTISLPHA